MGRLHRRFLLIARKIGYFQSQFILGLIYFVVVVPMTRLQSRVRGSADADTPAPSDEAKLLTEIRDLLSRQSL